MLLGVTGIPEAFAYQASDYQAHYSDVSTTPHADTAAYYQRQMQYTAGVYTDVDASDADARMGQDNLFYASGHGSQSGGIAIKQGSWLWANFPGQPTISDNDLRYLALAVYSSCYSSYDGQYGNLAQKSVDKGADAAIGWPDTIYSGQSGTWDDDF